MHVTQHFTEVWGGLLSRTTTEYVSSRARGCFTDVSRALQNMISKFVYSRSAQIHAVGTSTKFQLEILTIDVISGIMYFREFILELTKR